MRRLRRVWWHGMKLALSRLRLGTGGGWFWGRFCRLEMLGINGLRRPFQSVMSMGAVSLCFTVWHLVMWIIQHLDLQWVEKHLRQPGVNVCGCKTQSFEALVYGWTWLDSLNILWAYQDDGDSRQYVTLEVLQESMFWTVSAMLSWKFPLMSLNCIGWSFAQLLWLSVCSCFYSCWRSKLKLAFITTL